MNVKNYFVALLSSVLVLTLTFAPLTGSQITPQYDPWVDINDDGAIDIFDAIQLASTFGTTGDPTKNVNVTNWPIDEQGNLKVNVIPKGNLTLIKDSVKIVAVDTFEKGIPAYIDEPWNGTFWDFFISSWFVFTAKKGFNNVTRVIIQVISSVNATCALYFSVSMGHIDDYTGFVCSNEIIGAFPFFPPDPRLWTVFIIDAWWNQYLGPYHGYSGIDLLSRIKPGINAITIGAKLSPDSSTSTITTYRVEIFIEYTYWDYIE